MKKFLKYLTNAFCVLTFITTLPAYAATREQIVDGDVGILAKAEVAENYKAYMQYQSIAPRDISNVYMDGALTKKISWASLSKGTNIYVFKKTANSMRVMFPLGAEKKQLVAWIALADFTGTSPEKAKLANDNLSQYSKKNEPEPKKEPYKYGWERESKDNSDKRNWDKDNNGFKRDTVVPANISEGESMVTLTPAQAEQYKFAAQDSFNAPREVSKVYMDSKLSKYINGLKIKSGARISVFYKKDNAWRVMFNYNAVYRVVWVPSNAFFETSSSSTITSSSRKISKKEAFDLFKQRNRW